MHGQSVVEGKKNCLNFILDQISKCSDFTDGCIHAFLLLITTDIKGITLFLSFKTEDSK